MGKAYTQYNYVDYKLEQRMKALEMQEELKEKLKNKKSFSAIKNGKPCKIYVNTEIHSDLEKKAKDSNCSIEELLQKSQLPNCTTFDKFKAEFYKYVQANNIDLSILNRRSNKEQRLLLRSLLEIFKNKPFLAKVTNVSYWKLYRIVKEYKI